VCSKNLKSEQAYVGFELLRQRKRNLYLQAKNHMAFYNTHSPFEAMSLMSLLPSLTTRNSAGACRIVWDTE